jgi:hypothetical protein
MGGSPAKIIRKVISPVTNIIGGGDDTPAQSATSAIQDRRKEVVKETAAEGKKLVSKKFKRSRRSRSNLAGDFTQTAALGTGVRNPSGTGKTKLGA